MQSREERLVAKRAYYKKNREKLIEKQRQYRKRNIEKRQLYERMYDLKRQGKKKLYNLQYSKDKRQKAINILGAECTCCGENRYEFLAIDHKNNDGKEHRLAIGHNGAAIIRWIALNPKEAKEKLQILCHNCNLAKAFYGRCPHNNI